MSSKLLLGCSYGSSAGWWHRPHIWGPIMYHLVAGTVNDMS